MPPILRQIISLGRAFVSRITAAEERKKTSFFFTLLEFQRIRKPYYLFGWN